MTSRRTEDLAATAAWEAEKYRPGGPVVASVDPVAVYLTDWEAGRTKRHAVARGLRPGQPETPAWETAAFLAVLFTCGVFRMGGVSRDCVACRRLHNRHADRARRVGRGHAGRVAGHPGQLARSGDRGRAVRRGARVRGVGVDAMSSTRVRVDLVCVYFGRSDECRECGGFNQTGTEYCSNDCAADAAARHAVLDAAIAQRRANDEAFAAEVDRLRALGHTDTEITELTKGMP